MSKTAQKKRNFYIKGGNDFKKGNVYYEPYYRRSHPFNISYRDGYFAAKNHERKKKILVKRTWWQWLKWLFFS